MADKQDFNDSKFEGLAEQIKLVIRDQQFQASLDKFTSKSNSLIKVVQGIGFTLVLLSGVFGYLIAANSEAADRRAQMLYRVIDHKRTWLVTIDTAVMKFRKTHYLLKYDCLHNRAISLYEQGKQRYLARNELLSASAGVLEIFGKDVQKIILEMTKQDEAHRDICAQGAPSDQVWEKMQREIDTLMQIQIERERQALEDVEQNFLQHLFARF